MTRKGRPLPEGRPTTTETASNRSHRQPATSLGHAADRLAVQEQRIAAALTSAAHEIGDALAEVRDNGLYRAAGYATFKDYVTARWQFSDRRARQLIGFANVRRSLAASGTTVPLPANEREARDLVGLLDDPDALRDRWENGTTVPLDDDALAPVSGQDLYAKACDITEQRTHGRHKEFPPAAMEQVADFPPPRVALRPLVKTFGAPVIRSTARRVRQDSEVVAALREFMWECLVLLRYIASRVAQAATHEEAAELEDVGHLVEQVCTFGVDDGRLLSCDEIRVALALLGRDVVEPNVLAWLDDWRNWCENNDEPSTPYLLVAGRVCELAGAS
jgi:hypothetical protein